MDQFVFLPLYLGVVLENLLLLSAAAIMLFGESPSTIFQARTNNCNSFADQFRDILAWDTVVCSQPLMSDRLPLNQLMKDYAEGDYVYQEKLKDLQSRYRDLRRTRGDGNCFYRAFGFSYLEKLLDDKSDLPRFKEVIHQSKEDMVNLGFPQFTLEDFYDTVSFL
ncbi:ubiquitin thioesterase OTUB1 [Octopus sinensis]|uniref:Ubiquitin thioesterase OTUB1 n=2 Tax=Octopus TaxID=6643 RepID=A0A6P7SWR7_9MOLL|nr:ubiquitin thioesterase OTUB1 [Octopus sinensis]